MAARSLKLEMRDKRISKDYIRRKNYRFYTTGLFTSGQNSVIVSVEQKGDRPERKRHDRHSLRHIV